MPPLPVRHLHASYKLLLHYHLDSRYLMGFMYYCIELSALAMILLVQLMQISVSFKHGIRYARRS